MNDRLLKTFEIMMLKSQSNHALFRRGIFLELHRIEIFDLYNLVERRDNFGAPEKVPVRLF